MPALGATVAPARAEATDYVPIHGVVIAQPNPHLLTVRLDPRSPGEPVQTRVMHVSDSSDAVLRAGTGIDALADLGRSEIRDIAPVEAEIAGLPDPRFVQLAPGAALPDFVFVDQLGRRRTLAQYRGKYLILSFFYTRCPDRNICPAISARFAYLQSRIDPQTTQLLEITLDPRHDMPQRLRDYGAQFAADPDRWALLTAEYHTVDDALALFGLSNLQTDPANYIHDDVLAIVDPGGKLTQTVTTAGWSPDDVLASVAYAQGAPSNPLRRFELAAIANLLSACGGSTTAAVAVMDSVIFILGVVILGGILAWFGRKIWS